MSLEFIECQSGDEMMYSNLILNPDISKYYQPNSEIYSLNNNFFNEVKKYKYPFCHFIAKSIGQAIGIISIYPTQNNLIYGMSIYVIPSQQGKGYGKKMLREFINEVKKWKKKGIIANEKNMKLEAVIHVDNIASLKIFKAIGFETVGRAKFINGINAYLLRLALD